VRLQEAWPSSVDAQNNLGYSAIIHATFWGEANNVHLLATMGTDLSLKDDDDNNVYDVVELSDESDAKKAVVYKALAEHDVTSNDIPQGFQSPLYFESTYYDANLREQRWIERRALMMSIDRIFNWSVANQVESERLMTLPADLSSIGLLVAECCMHVDAISVSNGIARLIMEYSFGFDRQRRRLEGMPREGADLDNYEERIALRRKEMQAAAAAASEETRMQASGW
jgi:hypothetical protein